jgi:hypothetical protein
MIRLCIRAALLLFATSSPLVSGCGGNSGPAEYPEVRINAAALQLSIQDPRRKFYDTVTEPSDASEMGTERYPQRLPRAFEQAAIARLGQITGKAGDALLVEATVSHADVSFTYEPRGRFVRYDVALKFRVTTQSGALLEKGNGAAWRELPEREANEATLAQTFEATALEAFDRYFADAEMLERVNSQLAAHHRGNRR